MVYVNNMKPSELLNWRKKNGYSQIKLGKALGVSTITVYRWEKSMRQIPPFLHLALEGLLMKGGKSKAKGKIKKTKKRKGVKL